MLGGDRETKDMDGKNADFQIGWKQKNKKIIDLLLGFGMGSRSQSITLGAAGSVLTSERLGLYVGTALSTFLSEYGVVGVTLLGIFLIWLFGKLLKRKGLTDEQHSFAVGLAIFTSCLPILLFYQTYSVQILSNLLYWIGVGYIFKIKGHQTRGKIFQTERVRRNVFERFSV